MTRWWNSVQEEIISLESCFKKLEWGSKRKLVYSLKDWKALEERFEDYSGQLKRVSSKSKSRKRTPSPRPSSTSTSSKTNKYSCREADGEAVKVRRVGERAVLSKPRRAIAVTNSSSSRTL